MLYVKFIQNWKDSLFNGTTTGIFNGVGFTDFTGDNVISLYSHIPNSIIGTEIVVSGTISNDGTYTVIDCSYDSEMGATQLTVTESVTPESANNVTITSSSGILIFFPTITLKNTSIYSDGLKLVDINYDAESYMADDFFLREPREAKIELFRDDDDWLRDNFLYHNDNEINHVLYMDEDGTILEYEGIDPDLSIGDPLDGGTIDDKEVLIQQFSKIIVEIWNSNNDETPVFTGLVDKSQTSATHKRITLNCIDFTGLIKIFGEQLIKILITTENEDYYQFIISPNIIDELMDKIKDFTKLELEISNNFSNYLGTATNNNNNLELGEIAPNYTDIPGWPFSGYNGDVEEYLSESIFASDLTKYFVIYRIFTFSTYEYDMYPSTQFMMYVKWSAWTQEGGIVQNTTYGYPVMLAYRDEDTGVIYPYITLNEAINQFKTMMRLAPSYYNATTMEINYVKLNLSGNYDIIQMSQDRYSIALPIYSDTYTYMELFKTILFLNILTIYADDNGNINVKSKYFEDEVAGESTIINERDIMDGYTLGAI